MNNNLNITPKTKIGELLDAYPQLEETLIRLSPEFSKLKNPILRKTIAKIATLQQAAAMGKINITVLINTLRKDAGLSATESSNTSDEHKNNEIPAWIDETKITIVFNATPAIIAGEHPMPEIMSKAGTLKENEIMEFHTPFYPAPLIDILKSKGFQVFGLEINASLYKNYVRKK